MTSRRKQRKQNYQNANPPKEPKIHFKPLQFRSLQQQALSESIRQNAITFAVGSAGTGKTYIGVATAIDMLRVGETNKIVITRPAVEAGENLGFLPGPQPLTAKVLTPNGWTTMGAIKQGDLIIGQDGKPTTVIGVYPKGIKPVYEIKTSNGGVTHACEDHYWATKTFNEKKHNKDWQIRSTKEIMETLYNENTGPKYNHYLPSNDIIIYNSNHELPIPPYVLGVILGDGNIGNSISFGSVDKEIIERVEQELLQYNISLSKNGDSISYRLTGEHNCNKTPRQIKITNIENNNFIVFDRIGDAVENHVVKLTRSCMNDRCTRGVSVDGYKYEFLDKQTRWTNYIKNALYELGLEGTKSDTKFIPDIYKYTSIENREALLQGLMDTDGSIKKSTGEQIFYTSSPFLRDDIIELTRSLGVNSTYSTRNRIGKINKRPGENKGDIETKLLSYVVQIPKFNNEIVPFYLTRKRNRILPSNKIVHNVITEINYIGEEEVQCIKVDNNNSLYITDDFIVTHNTFAEKLDVYLYPIYDAIDGIVGPYMRKRWLEDGTLVILPIAYMRGTTLDNCVAILDEAQNANKMQLKMILTRLGKNGKLIINGDPDQNDIKNPALSEVVDALKGSKDINVVEFGSEHVVRHSVVKTIIEKLK